VEQRGAEAVGAGVAEGRGGVAAERVGVGAGSEDEGREGSRVDTARRADGSPNHQAATPPRTATPPPSTSSPERVVIGREEGAATVSGDGEEGEDGERGEGGEDGERGEGEDGERGEGGVARAARGPPGRAVEAPGEARVRVLAVSSAGAHRSSAWRSSSQVA
jgi:hypothetical protein